MSNHRGWDEHVLASLRERRCPHSGLRLYRHLDAWDRDTLMCSVCDCFGYDPTDERIGKQ